jgi:hypothetical protein
MNTDALTMGLLHGFMSPQYFLALTAPRSPAPGITNDFGEQALESAMDTILPPTGTIYEEFDELGESPSASELDKQASQAGKGLVIGLVIGKVLFG